MERCLARWLCFSLAWLCGCGPMWGAPPVQDGLAYVVAIPVPIDQTNAAGAAGLRTALGQIRTAVPQAGMVFVGFDVVASTRADWLAVLNACSEQGFQAIVAFIDQSIGEGYRPTKMAGVWQFRQLGAFVQDAAVVTHPALYAVVSLDEPWNPAKTPAFYPTNFLTEMAQALRGLAPGGVPVRLMMNFSREIWKYGERDDANDPYYYAPGICDVVMISALEFQRDGYDFATLDLNHTESRRIIARETPGLPLFSSVQVFGSRYGPFQPGATSGYWFPREREGYHDLLTLLEDVTRPKYQFLQPLTGLAVQKWDSNDTVGRNASFTAGDGYLPGAPAVQAQAANEALAALQLWITHRDADADGVFDYWELLHGLDPANAADAALDADGDGQSNRAEFLSRTDPQAPSSALRVEAIWREGGNVRLRFPAAAGVEHVLQKSDAPAGSAWQTLLAIPAVATDRAIEVTAGKLETAGWYRVGVE